MFSLGICLLEACTLQQANGLNVPGCLTSNTHAELYETVMGLNCEKVLKCLLLVCLKHDESTRPDWRTLVDMIRCEGFGLVNYVPVNEAYLLNERMYEGTPANPQDNQDRQSAGHHSLSHDNPPIEEMSAQSVEEPSMVVYVPYSLPTKKVTVVTKVPKKY